MNPFRNTIVTSPWEVEGVDVVSIHGDVLDRCLSGLEYVRAQGRSASLLIHGEAGSGKTHLLKRLRELLAPAAPIATDRAESLYVWVRLQTSPRMIWRTLRRTLVDDWFRPLAEGRSQFDRILFHRLAEIRIAEGDLEPWYEYMRDEKPDELEKLMEQIATNLHLDRNTAIAFRHIAFGRHRRDLHAWLGGTSLPAAALERMELAQDEGTDEEREDDARRVVLMLCRLAGNGLPIVLSFDQVEALEATPGDQDGLFSFGQLTSTLHDQSSNVLLISSVQSSFATRLKDVSRAADYDRMTSLGSVSLDPLTPLQAELLINARLESAADCVPTDAGDSRCWPLEQREFDSLFSDTRPLTPRRLLNRCAERFDVRQGLATAMPEGGAIPVEPHASLPSRGSQSPIETFLNDKWVSCLEEKRISNSADQTEEILRHGLPLLVQLRSPELRAVHDEKLPDVPLVFEQTTGRIGVSLCTQGNMTSLATRLKRLKKQFSERRLERLAIVRESRVPLSEGAKVARQTLADLEQLPGVKIVFPSPEILAAIDALRALLSDAKSGDLNWAGEAVAPKTVEDWLRANLANDLSNFMDEVFGSPAAASGAAHPQLLEALNTLLAEQPMLPLDEAAQRLQRPVEELQTAILCHPDHFGLLGQPPTVLFRIQTSSLFSG